MRGKSLTEESTEQVVAHSIARDATDDEDLTRVRLMVRRMRRGNASIREVRHVVDTMEFLLRYIDRCNTRWHGRIEEEVGLRIRRRDESTRIRKQQTQRKRREQVSQFQDAG